MDQGFKIYKTQQILPVLCRNRLSGGIRECRVLPGISSEPPGHCRVAGWVTTPMGLPLSVSEKTGICKLLTPILDKLDIYLNRACMHNRVLLQANQLRQVIAAEVEGKYICLKVDIASRNERGFLGINIQYILEGCLRLRTLAVKEMFERHTGKEIKRCILDVLESFRINIFQVYSITTDNASNMLKCGQLIYEEVEEALDHELEGNRDEQPAL